MVKSKCDILTITHIDIQGVISYYTQIYVAHHLESTIQLSQIAKPKQF